MFTQVSLDRKGFFGKTAHFKVEAFNVQPLFGDLNLSCETATFTIAADNVTPTQVETFTTPVITTSIENTFPFEAIFLLQTAGIFGFVANDVLFEVGDLNLNATTANISITSPTVIGVYPGVVDTAQINITSPIVEYESKFLLSTANLSITAFDVITLLGDLNLAPSTANISITSPTVIGANFETASTSQINITSPTVEFDSFYTVSTAYINLISDTAQLDAGEVSVTLQTAFIGLAANTVFGSGEALFNTANFTLTAYDVGYSSIFTCQTAIIEIDTFVVIGEGGIIVDEDIDIYEILVQGLIPGETDFLLEDWNFYN